jgi:hypothetical protein
MRPCPVSIESPSRNSVSSLRSARRVSITPPQRASGRISTPLPGRAVTILNSSTVTLESPPAYEDDSSVPRECPPVFLESPPASQSPPEYTEKLSAVLKGSAAVDVESSSTSKWGLHRIRPYVSTMFKPSKHTSASASRTT